MEYKIEAGGNLVALSGTVNKYISLGWEPLGHPFHNAEMRCWCQTMIRRSAPPIEPELKLSEHLKGSKRK